MTSEVRPLAELRDARLHIPSLRSEQPGPGAVAVRDSGCRCARNGPRRSARWPRSCQLLHHHPDRLADQINTLTSTKRLEQLGYDSFGL